MASKTTNASEACWGRCMCHTTFAECCGIWRHFSVTLDPSPRCAVTMFPFLFCNYQWSWVLRCWEFVWLRLFHWDSVSPMSIRFASFVRIAFYDIFCLGITLTHGIIIRVSEWFSFWHLRPRIATKQETVWSKSNGCMRSAAVCSQKLMHWRRFSFVLGFWPTWLPSSARWSGDVILEDWGEHFKAVSHNHARPWVLFSNISMAVRHMVWVQHEAKSRAKFRSSPFYLSVYWPHTLTGHEGIAKNNLLR